MRTRSHYRARYVLLAIIAILLLPAQIRVSLSSVQRLLWPADHADLPFDMHEDHPEVRVVRPAGEAAGIHEGDRIVSINEMEYRGGAQLLRPIGQAEPGDTLVVRVLRDGDTKEFHITLPRRPPVTDSAEILLAVVQDLAIPLFCTLLGFWVAAIRPRDPLAWLLLGLMLSFSYVLNPASSLRLGGWIPVIRDVAVFARSFFSLMWGPAMMLFGIYFPDRLDLDKRAPWAKWLILAPALTASLLISAYFVATLENAAVAEKLGRALSLIGSKYFWITILSLSLFFPAVWRRLSSSRGDARRRLKLLCVGSTVAFAPIAPHCACAGDHR